VRSVPEPIDARGLRHRLAELVGLFGLLGIIGFGWPVGPADGHWRGCGTGRNRPRDPSL